MEESRLGAEVGKEGMLPTKLPILIAQIHYFLESGPHSEEMRVKLMFLFEEYVHI